MRASFIGSVLLVSLVACQGGQPSIEEARAQITATALEAEEQDAARRAGLSQFWSARVTTALEHAACPYELPADGSHVRGQIVSVADLESTAGPRLEAFSTDKTRLMAEILLMERPSAPEGRELLAEAQAAAEPWPWDITIIARDFTRPRFTHDGIYFPGMVGGQVVLWDYQNARVACAARVAETNSPDVLDRARGDESAAFDADPVGFLEDDLVRTAWAGALRDLRVFDPTGAPVPEETAEGTVEGSGAE